MAWGELQSGQRLGKQEIVRKLATGGMAEIYLARTHGAAGFEKLVALKRIVSTDHGLVTMFLDEARIAATLRHANIAEVIDVGHEDHSYFFTMEYIDGRDAREIRLEAHKRATPIPFGIALAIACGATAALAYVHDKAGPKGPLDLVHRDVSPSNILVSYDGAVKLVDFGVARATGRSTKTLTGTLKGKISYMSPEQCRGRPLDRRSDLFSLGIVLYELTTGIRPFQGTSDLEVLEGIVNGFVTPPSHVVADYPHALELITMRLLQLDPRDRYQTAHAVLADLEALAQGVFTSSLAVARFMRELFAHGAPPEPVDFNPDTVPSGFVGEQTRSLRPVQEDNSEDSTGFFEEARTREAKPAASPARPPRASATVEMPRSEAFDPDTAFQLADPIASQRAGILADIDASAPAAESIEGRTRRRIETLLDRAFACQSVGELEQATIAIEVALCEAPGSRISKQLIDHHRATIVGVFEAFLAPLDQRPTLARPIEELAILLFDSGVSGLLAQVDGSRSIHDLRATSGLSPLDTYRELCQLVLTGSVLLGIT